MQPIFSVSVWSWKFILLQIHKTSHNHPKKKRKKSSWIAMHLFIGKLKIATLFFGRLFWSKNWKPNFIFCACLQSDTFSRRLLMWFGANDQTFDHEMRMKIIQKMKLKLSQKFEWQKMAISVFFSLQNTLDFILFFCTEISCNKMIQLMEMKLKWCVYSLIMANN